MKVALYTILGLVLIVFLPLIFYVTVGVPTENAKRKMVENTQTYNDGKVKALYQLYKEYNASKDPNDKEAIKVIIRDQFYNYDPENINNPTLKAFLQGVMSEY